MKERGQGERKEIVTNNSVVIHRAAWEEKEISGRREIVNKNDG